MLQNAMMPIDNNSMMPLDSTGAGLGGLNNVTPNPGALGGTGVQTQNMPGQSLGVNNLLYNANNGTQSAMNTLQQNNGFNQGQFNQFMNPYISDVNNQLANQSNINFGQNVAPQIQSQFGGGGQFGSARNVAGLQQAANQQSQNLMSQQAQNLSQGFQNSMQNYGQFQGLAQNAGTQMGNLSNMTNNIAQSQAMLPYNQLQSISETAALARLPSTTETQSGSSNPYYMPGF